MFFVIEDVFKETSSPLFRPLLFGDAGLRSKARWSVAEDFSGSVDSSVDRGVGYGSSVGSSPTSGTSAWWHDFANGSSVGSSVGYGSSNGSSNGSSVGPSTPTSGTSAWWHDFADNWIIKPGGGVQRVVSTTEQWLRWMRRAEGVLLLL